jgi:hypothetical protein
MSKTDVDYKRFDDGPTEGGQSMKCIAFIAVVFSTVAVSACFIAFPLVLENVQRLQSEVQAEVDFCKTETLGLWKQLLTMDGGAGAPGVAEMFLGRNKRQSDDQCCSCQQGPPGSAGLPGNDGNAGASGNDGNGGAPGQDAEPTDALLPVPEQCPCSAVPGGPGPVGGKGPDGPSGNAGRPGGNGNSGRVGEAGSSGPPGSPGNPGNNGPSGQGGNLLPGANAPAGPPGPNGQRGNPGQAGNNGLAGKDGDNGAPGSPGQGGQPGSNGQAGQPGKAGDPGNNGGKGSCNTCPPARLAPGY